MNESGREIIISKIESYYSTRIPELLDEDRYDDVDAIFKEFVVNGEEPKNWMFMDFIVDVF